MNQAISRQRNNPLKLFWLLTLAVTLFLYIPFFVGEYDLRQDQIRRGISPELAVPVLDSSDSGEYALLAKNLSQTGTFSLDGKTPETFRTIGYPALVALYLARGLPLAAFPLVQILLAALTAYGIFLIARRFWNPNVGIIAGLLYLLDPVTSVSTFLILTDVFYVFLLVYSVYFFFASPLPQRWAWAIGGGLLGISTLVRPISMFLLIVFAIIYLLKYRKQAVIPILLCVVVYAAAVLPWVIRNKQAIGVYGISTVKSFNLYHYYVPEFLAYQKGISPVEARKIVGEGMGTFDERSLANASKMQSRAVQIILENPVQYGMWSAVKAIPFFLSSGVETFFTSYNTGAGREVFGTIKENMTGLLLSGKFGEAIRVLRENPAIGAEQIILLGMWLLALLSIYMGYKQKQLFPILLLWAIILYFAVLTGPVAYARYRLPATPFLFMLVSYAIVVRSYASLTRHPETR